jgi:ribosome-associated protein
MENKNSSLVNASSYDVACAAVKALIKMKGSSIKMFCVKDTSSVTDYYITVTGRSKTQVSSLAEEVVYQLGEAGRDAARVEGKRGDTWILVDYIDVIVQIFDREARDFYDFDRLLAEAELVDISHIEEELDNEN